MTDFLRRHPEIAKTFLDSLRPSLNGYISTEEHRRALAAVLPAILAAHEADLAACDEDGLVKRAFDFWYDCEGNSEDFVTFARSERAAAYLAGRRAGREDFADPDDRMVEAAARVIDPDVFPPQPQTGQKTLSQWYAFAPGRVEGRAVAITKAKAAIRAAMKAAGE